MPSIDFDELDERGYTVLPNLVDVESLTNFETAIDAAAQAQAEKYDIPLIAAEPFIDVMQKGGAYRSLLFGLSKYLYVLHKISGDVGVTLEKGGFFDWSEQTTPLFWSTLRADLPGEQVYLLPMHQDYGSIKCEKSWRVWIPLRPVDRDHGTMEVAVGSHKISRMKYDTSDPKETCVDPAEYEDLPIDTLELPAGHGVLFNNYVAHRSVAGASDRVKYILAISLQDLATMADPDDPDDEVAGFMRMAAARDADRKTYLAGREVQ